MIKFLTMFQHFFHQIHFSSALFCNVLIFPLKILYCIYIVVLISEAYSDPCQTSKMEFLRKQLTVKAAIFAKHSSLDIWQCSEYSFGWLDIIVGAFLKNQQYIKSIDQINIMEMSLFTKIFFMKIFFKFTFSEDLINHVVQ